MAQGPAPDLVHVTLTKEQGCLSYGMHLKRQKNGRILVHNIARGGSMAQWNADHPLQQIEAGDRIVSINGAIARDALQVWFTANHPMCVSVNLIVARTPQRAAHPADNVASAEDFLETLDTDIHNAVGSAECAICLEELGPNSDVVVLPCRHAFHRGCAHSWLDRCPHLRAARCPTCRKAPIPGDAAEIPKSEDAGGLPWEPTLSTNSNGARTDTPAPSDIWERLTDTPFTPPSLH